MQPAAFVALAARDTAVIVRIEPHSTGYLDDGTSGMRAIKRCRGVCIAQGPSDAAHPDVPQSVIRHAGTVYCVPLAQIGALLEKLAARKVGVSKQPPADLAFEAKIAQRVVSDLKSVESQVRIDRIRTMLTATDGNA